eukprot:scaffold148415_cov52-Attheya_sp.AAC.5
MKVVQDDGGEMERANSSSSSGGGGEVGVVTLLELPVEKTTLIVDGEPRRLVHANFAGLCQIPSQDQFHLLVVRVISDENNGAVSHATGLVILWSIPGRISRHYNAYTEELNENETPQQLNTSTNRQHHPPTPPLLVPYDQFVSQSTRELWRGQTRYIQRSLLGKRGLTGQGDKVVPGAYDDDEDKEEGTKQSNDIMADGKSVQYPVGIPCLEDASSSSSSSSNPRSLLHEGTKQYLRTLTPTQRTALLCSPKPAADAAFWNVFQTIYQNSWQDVLGDVQLSRDLVSMLSLVSDEVVSQQTMMYSKLLTDVIHNQLLSIEKDFFQEVEYSGGNFFVPALERLYRVCKKVEAISNESVTDPLANILWRQFQIRINNDDDDMQTKEMDSDDDDEENVMEIDVNDGSAGTDISTTLHTKITADSPKQMAQMDSDDEEEDGPAVVPYDEVEASMERTAAIPPTPKKYEEDAKRYQNAYPLLFAATTPQEDVVMACARILSDATDVSLVREAAAYLEEVEAKQDTLF